MQGRGNFEIFMYGTSLVYMGRVSEDYVLKAPLADLEVNIGFMLAAGGLAGILYLLRRRWERAQPTEG